jgi:SAGA-associated factor 29
LILLPNPNERIKEFSKGTQVLAMFPDTTSFYPATVVVPPKKKSPDYLLQFVDDDDEAGLTPQRKIKPKYVVARIDTLSRGD